MQQGLIQRTPRGRMLSASGWRYLGLTPRAVAAAQLELLPEDTAEGDDA